jgi:hypothetical protein
MRLNLDTLQNISQLGIFIQNVSYMKTPDCSKKVFAKITGLLIAHHYAFECKKLCSLEFFNTHVYECAAYAIKHNILMGYYVCNILPASYHSSVILFLSNVIDMKTFLSSLCHIYLAILHPNFISAPYFFFALSSLRSLYKASFCIRWMRLKNGVVLLTSYVQRIAVTLFLQFVFVITNNNKIKCCSRNERFYPIPSSF